METVLQQILNKAHGRKIVFYGASYMAEALLLMLKQCDQNVDFFVDQNYQIFQDLSCKVLSPKCLIPEKHYIIIVPFGSQAILSIENDLMKIGYDRDDWFVWYRDVERDINVNGVLLGKRFQLSKALVRYYTPRYIESVGKYTSINYSFAYAADHAFGLTTSSVAFFHNNNIEFSKLKIGHDVWIGANVFVNCSKTKNIGNGAIVGSGAVVIEDVPPYAIVAGVPARIIRYRFSPENIDILQKVQWWNWSDEQLRENADCFEDYNVFFERFK